MGINKQTNYKYSNVREIQVEQKRIQIPVQASYSEILLVEDVSAMIAVFARHCIENGLQCNPFPMINPLYKILA